VLLKIRAVLVAAALSLVIVPSAQSQNLAGPYLAAKQASYNNDYLAAARLFTEAIAADPDNPTLMQNALLAYIGTGAFPQALAVARRLEAIDADSQLANLVVLVDALSKGANETAAAFFAEGKTFSPLLDGLLSGWVNLGMGRMSDAAADFDLMAENDAMRIFADYHKALALASVGDFESADRLMTGAQGLPIRIGRGSLVAHVQIASQLEQFDAAIEYINSALNDSGDLELLAMRQTLSEGKPLEFDVVRSAQDGAAEVFLTLAAVLAGEENDRFALIYARMAEYLRPDLVRATLLAAELLTAEGQFDLAIRNYDSVPADDPAFYSAEVGRADALLEQGKSDAAIEVLRSLTKTYSTIPTIFSSLGDAFRRNSRFEEAVEAYSSAIALLPEPQPHHWFLYYARGISFERTDSWEKAEQDFRFSLELSPDQPLVLNYLGYGLVEKRIKLDEALQMIETAVERRPNDGYITDSLGWVLYRLGKFDEAVAPMERAVELMPVDPIVNDHLGDVFWMVGRKLEARFQWRRALSFDPEEADADRIRLKLEFGLDEVLQREADADATAD